MSFRISEQAKQDLENIWLFTLHTWSLEQADRYLMLLMNEMDYLSAHFESGKDMDYVRKGYRASKVNAHLIFYRKSTDGITEIIRILHQRMDIENRLKE